jgi:antitoxin MazE
VKVGLVRIGNSRGVRIPKPIIEQCGFGDTVDLRVEKNCVVITPERSPRQGWNEAFAAAGTAAQDELLLDLPNEFDEKDWRW